MKLITYIEAKNKPIAQRMGKCEHLVKKKLERLHYITLVKKKVIFGV